MKSQFSKNIRAVRNSHELTQKQLADRVGVREQTVIKWDGGDVEKPRQKAIVDKLREVFGVTEQDLFGYADGFYAKLHGLTDAPAGAISPTGSASAFLTLRGRVHEVNPTDHENLDGTVELPASVAANHPHAYFIEVEGDCMDRVYPDGCYILVDHDRAPADGSMLPQLASSLEAWRVAQASQLSLIGIEQAPETPVVTSAVGTRMRAQNLARWWKRHMSEIGVDCRPHELRHTFLTMLANSGASAASMRSIAGWSSIEIASVYVHDDMEANASAVWMLGSRFSSGTLGGTRFCTFSDERNVPQSTEEYRETPGQIPKDVRIVP